MIDNAASPRSTSGVTLGLLANWRQFALLVLINAFVGGMVGIERTVVPLIGVEEFRISSTTLVVSFIISFGVVKAFANLSRVILPMFGAVNACWSSAGWWAFRFPS